MRNRIKINLTIGETLFVLTMAVIGLSLVLCAVFNKIVQLNEEDTQQQRAKYYRTHSWVNPDTLETVPPTGGN